MLPDLDSLALFVRAAETRNLMRAEMTNYGTGHTAVLRIHGNTSAMAQFLPADVASFQPKRPDIRLVLEECWSTDAIRGPARSRPGRAGRRQHTDAPARGTDHRADEADAARVQVRSFEAVCRAVEAGLGIGLLPLQAARGSAHSMRLQLVPIVEPWAARRMQLVTRSAPEPGSPLGALVEHLLSCTGPDTGATA
ncbi:MAG: hypothetical protein JSW68_12580 [Burkholderiales bacterium]|nr:MAG: hypothetical protein JSW68_12580 [Burkholderiales bacterium]